MKMIILISLMTLSVSALAGHIFKDATLSELKVLTTYLEKSFGGDETLEGALDDDSFRTQEFSYQGINYKMIIVYSGDTAHGPIYNPQTLEIVGEMSDGSLIINGRYVEIEK
jgi:hypothetical protein